MTIIYCSVIVYLFSTTGVYCQNLNILLKLKTNYLDSYITYLDATVNHVRIPEDVSFVSFKFAGSSIDTSLFGCGNRNVSLFMKYGSVPVINPDNSTYSPYIKNISRSPIYSLEFLSNNQNHYINITSPKPGFYYLSTFLSYQDPKFKSIMPQGLGNCYTSVDITVYLKEFKSIKMLVEDETFAVNITKPGNLFYKFYVPKRIFLVYLLIKDLQFELGWKLLVRINENSLPYNGSKTDTREVDLNKNNRIQFWVNENTWYYLQFVFETSQNQSPIMFDLSLGYIKGFEYQDLRDEINDDFKTSIHKIYYDSILRVTIPHRQYDLVKDMSSDSFVFSFDLPNEVDNMLMPLPINLTNSDYTVLKFRLLETVDVGGSIIYTIAFQSNNERKSESKLNHLIVGCISQDGYGIPVYPNKCLNNGHQTDAPIIINNTNHNSTLYIPYPESGNWYATLKLYCGSCEKCGCSETCQKLITQCTLDCQEDSVNSTNSSCFERCQTDIIKKEGCQDCNCDGDCNKPNRPCKESILYDISSFPCYMGRCGRNGKCIFMISNGMLYSACHCFNGYSGIDCSDGSHATQPHALMLELLLLVLSNLAFLPAVYIAYKRKYYVESVIYFSSFFFSTFYHACDAGENMINYCLSSMNSLQFGDFFCALLSIFVTLVAMADLSKILTSLSHVIGAIVLSYCTVLARTSAWIFFVPSAFGLMLITASWYRKYRKVRQRFLEKKYLCVYLPLGIVIIALGLIIYGFLETRGNYMFTHSAWHIIMASAIFLVLPRPTTFHPEAMI